MAKLEIFMGDVSRANSLGAKISLYELMHEHERV